MQRIFHVHVRKTSNVPCLHNTYLENRLHEVSREKKKKKKKHRGCCDLKGVSNDVLDSRYKHDSGRKFLLLIILSHVKY